ncbi:proteinase-activated receptor 1-like [Hydractinia symbiolongicarpus]|uniref:proteinase-activated receptor 1-like n=1 Tax=Hydractinia symbiolongicarpus TaxID=13093 RepID=UPI00254E86C2|nr:proteinase-activated receptor 1-like [Hydractinia symbiolongicarpus]
MIQDICVLIIYQYFGKVYESCTIYFELIEIVMLSIIFLSMILISADRFLCITLGVKYKAIVTRKKVKFTVVMIWIIGVISTIPFLFEKKRSHIKYIYYATFGALFVVKSVITYATIAYYMCSRTRNALSIQPGKGNIQSKPVSVFKKSYIVPCAIITTFVLFNVIPDVVCYNRSFDSTTYEAVLYFYATGYITDPLIYIFLNAETRATLCTHFLELRREIYHRQR